VPPDLAADRKGRGKMSAADGGLTPTGHGRDGEAPF
jgi:hypothetical protein